jgi:zinc transporter
VLIPEATYGSDEAGLVCGYVFAGGLPGRAVGAAEAAAWLTQAGDRPGAFAWLHFNLSHAAAEPWLREHLELPEGFYESLRSEGSATRVEQSEGSLLAILNDVLFEFDWDAGQVSTVSLCVQPQVVVSARGKPLRSIDQLRVAARAGETFDGSVELLAYLLRLQADVLVQILRQSTRRVDVIEDALLARRLRTGRADLGRLRRVLVRLQRLMAPEPAALFRLLSRPPAWIREREAQDLREAAEEFSTAVADCAALVERVKLLQEELAAFIADQNSRSLFILTMVTVLALPFNVIGGLFGMNVGGIPLANHEAGFWLIVGLVAGFTTLAGWLAFPRL